MHINQLFVFAESNPTAETTPFQSPTPTMPGRVKLTCEASVDTQPASASTKRKILATLQCPVAKRARDDDTAAAAVLSGESSRAQSPADTPATTPPSSQAVKRPTPKKKQVSKPRDKSWYSAKEGGFGVGLTRG